jgi:hypothetical protein
MTKEERVKIQLAVMRREKRIRSLISTQLNLMLGKAVCVACQDQESADRYARDIERLMGEKPQGLSFVILGEKELAGVPLKLPPILDDYEADPPTPEQQEHCLKLWRQVQQVRGQYAREDLATFGEEGYWREGPSFTEFLAGGAPVDPWEKK